MVQHTTGAASGERDRHGDRAASAPRRGDASGRADGHRTARQSRGPGSSGRHISACRDGDGSRHDFPVGGARVEAAADSNPSTPVATFATTGPDGRYKLYGVPAEAEIRVLKDGYIAAAERIQLAGHETRNFELRLVSPRPGLGGDYTMTVEAAGSCELPDDLRRRTYDAVIVQNGPQLTVTLTAPKFLVDAGGQGNRFTGMVTATGATFQMRAGYDFYYYPNNPNYPDVAELLPDGTLLVIVGRPAVTATSAGLSGQVFGTLTLYQGSSFPAVAYLNNCRAGRLTLTPR